MFFPIPTQLTGTRGGKSLPLANVLLIAANCLAWLQLDPRSWWVGPGTGIMSLITYGFVHANLLHLAFNMWFLWIFGNAVNRRIGNGHYLLSYLGIILLVGLLARLLSHGYCLGASGGVFGVMAIALLLLPSARVEVAYLMTPPLTLPCGALWRPQNPLFWFLRWGEFRVSALVGVGLFVLLELSAILVWGLNWTNLGHLFGFFAGVAAVLILPAGLTMKHRRPI